jgi:hypothetical protein
MKKFSFTALILFASFFSLFTSSHAQQAYWVFFTDKQGVSFDPYSYFDAKAVERYQQCGADLYDITNYPVCQAYEQGVSTLAAEEIGVSRWMNAIGVMATPDQIATIEALPYVLRVQPIEATGLQLTVAGGSVADSPELPDLFDIATVDGPLEAQLVRMGGQHFRDHGFDGHGIRIAVFDGGFPQVNTHAAFRHLRDNHRIIKTWNFPKDMEDVYGWNSHGTMTLSCIAGRMGDRDLGLATGAEFLLARTEVNSEPFKEEVWWQMAVEWADRNGANIISSSLGYGKERHYTTDMDGTSYVAKAGNLAARKGMLVINSAGNEGDDKQWKTIITPSDADSVLCVGGIENSLTEYNHISFSSYGPSADGRLKPNVCAFGYARTANTGKGDNKYHYVHGTSFSCPLVAGFAACAWQASPGKTAMEMFHEIERSGDLYPYYDYSFGYGVPQASHFLRTAVEPLAPTFRFEKKNGDILVRPLRPIVGKPIFYKEQHPDGRRIERYAKSNIVFLDTTGALHFTLQPNHTLVVHLDGYTAVYTAIDSFSSTAKVLDEYLFGDVVTADNPYVLNDPDYRTPEMNLTPSEWGSNAKYRWNVYFGFGLPISTESAEMPVNFWSPSWSFGFRFLRAYSKTYCLGIGIGMSFSHFRFNDAPINALETSLGITQADIGNYKKVVNRSLKMNEIFNIELFQRVRFRALGLFSNGLHWDLGIYASGCSDTYTLGGDTPDGSPSDYTEHSYVDPAATDDYHISYGVVTRLTYDVIGIYARYRLEDLGKDPTPGKVLLPRLTVGLQLQF